MNVVDRTLPISVVIPCFRCAATLGRAVQSIEQQSKRPAELILVDDASGDDTRYVLQEIGRQNSGWVKIISLDVNSGAATARNAGWSVASQPYIAFLDSDDSWHAEKLCIQYEYMVTNPEVALCGHRCLVLQKDTVPVGLSKFQSVTSVSSMSLMFRNPFSTPTVMIRRDIPFRFTSGKRYAEDFLLWQQIALAGLRIIRLEIPLAYVHKPFFGVHGLSNSMWKMEKGELDNFLFHYRSGAIGSCLYSTATAFSFLKYLIRTARAAPSRILRRRQKMEIG